MKTTRRNFLKTAVVGGAAVALPIDWLKHIPSEKKLGGPVGAGHSAALFYEGRQVTEWQTISNTRWKNGILDGDDMTWHSRTIAFDQVKINIGGVGTFNHLLGQTYHTVGGDATVQWNAIGIMRISGVE